MSGDRNKFQIAGLFPPWERSSFENRQARFPKSAFRRPVVSPPDEKTRYDAKASRPTCGRRRRKAAALSSSSPFFASRRTFFLLCFVNRLKIVSTLTLYPLFRAFFREFSFFPLDAPPSRLPILTAFAILSFQAPIKKSRGSRNSPGTPTRTTLQKSSRRLANASIFRKTLGSPNLSPNETRRRFLRRVGSTRFQLKIARTTRKDRRRKRFPRERPGRSRDPFRLRRRTRPGRRREPTS